MRKKFIVKNYRKKKIIFSIIFILLFSIGIGYSVISTNLSINGTIDISKYNDKTLYGVLRLEALRNGLAKEYIGEHHDSFTEEPSKKIYHWYAKNDQEGTQILDKNNVIFAGQCWQMIRTTDTGGVKMIYNGEAVDNQCLDTRGAHAGYASLESQNLASNYWYGTDYTYDSAAKTFKVSGTTEQTMWNESNGPGLVGKYTCKLTSEDGTCATLYLVESYYNTTSAYVIPLNSNSNYSQFGTLEFNASYNSPSYVGYMYNTVYPYKTSNGSSWGTHSQTINPIVESEYNITSNDATYPFTFDSNTNMWTSTMKQNSTSASIKFKVPNNNNYVINYTVSSETNYDKAYFYKNGTELKNESGSKSGTINLTGLTTADEIEVKYSKDSSSSSGTDSVSFSIGTPSGETVDNRYQFGNSVEYINGEYKLKDTIKAEVSDNLNNNHYTCFTTGDTCTKVNYIYYISSTTAYYIELENDKSVEDAINKMLHDDGVNQVNSTMKSGVDAWYKHYILEDYDDYIEDTIFCNDRSIRVLNGWNPDGGMTNAYLQFKECNVTSDLSCANTTDQFSISNNNAKLTYKVGLMSSPEMNILYNSRARKTGQYYWLASPGYFDRYGAGGRYVSTGGDMSGGRLDDSVGVRPAVSLTPGTRYSDGDGSMANPYIVSTE